MKKIIEQCPECGGTGLYSGVCEAKGTAVICVRCGGLGWTEYQYTEFTGRKRKAGIKRIMQSRGRFIATGVGPVGMPMTYAEFEATIPATTKKR